MATRQMTVIHHFIFVVGLVLFSFPVVFFQSSWSITNMILDLPILLILNILMMILFLETESRKFEYKSILLLVLASVAVLSAFLRLIPLPLGFTLSFLLPMASAIVFGPVFGFLIGQLSMIVSGLMMGSIGPWLPYQSFLMGMMAFYAGVLFHKRNHLFFVILYASVMSLFYGYWISITYWPIAVMQISHNMNLWEKIISYQQFYLVTSLVWDLTRVAGNIVVFILFYKPTIELLNRAKKRLTYYQ